MANLLDNGRSGLVLVGAGRGSALIPRGSPLTRLNYFDGKLLQAEDLRTEQDYLRALVHLSNRAGGGGVVHGFDLSLAAGDQLRVGPGLAIDGTGRVLLLPTEAEVGVAGLIGASRRGGARALRIAEDGSARFVECELVDERATEVGIPGRELYLIVAVHAEALCGEEDVYGRLCERACETETERPYTVEGVSLVALPLVLDAPLPAAAAVTLDRRHLRSRVASGFFDAQDAVPGDLLSRAGLSSTTWCRGARESGEGHVPLGVLAREGETTLFLDVWTARRERMETPPRGYWAGRMAMRPWNTYLAQILQFQCHLVDVLGGIPEPGTGDDPCRDEKEALEQTRRHLEELRRRLAGQSGEEEVSGDNGTTASLDLEDVVGDGDVLPMEDALAAELQSLTALNHQIVAALQSFRGTASDRVLIDGGIVELPPAGYLPVTPDSAISVNRQVRELMGQGVDLRFCVTRADFVAHALEEAQHMERISLLDGLDDASRRPAVDVLVPDGSVAGSQVAHGLYDVTVDVTPPAEVYPQKFAMSRVVMDTGVDTSASFEPELPTVAVRGVARVGGRDPSGGFLLGAGSALDISPPIGRLLSSVLADAVGRDTGTAMRMHRISAEGEEEDGDFDITTDDIRGFRPIHGGVIHGVVRDDAVSTLKQRAGLWITLQFDADPLALDEGDPMPCTLEAAVGLDLGGPPATIELTAEGRLVARSRSAADGTRVLEGRFPRVVVVAKPTVDGDPRQVVSADFALDAELEFSESSEGAASLVVRLSHDDEVTVTLRGIRRDERVEADARIQGEIQHALDSHIEQSHTRNAFRIEGVVRGLRDGRPLRGAEVVLEGSETSETTDESGFFAFGDVGAGSQTVRVTHSHMKPAETTLEMADQFGFRLQVGLAPSEEWSEDVTLRPVKVVARRTGRVLENDDPAHQAAVAGLELVGEGLGDPTFRPDAESNLFVKDYEEEGQVLRATRDWVLFHRRREKDCAPRRPRPDRPRDRRYRVYHVGLAQDSEDETAEILESAEVAIERDDPGAARRLLNQIREARGAEPLEAEDREALLHAVNEERALLESEASATELEPLLDALHSDDPAALAPFDVTEIGGVTFAGDGVSLTTPTTTVLEAWRRVRPGGAILLGAIGSRGEALQDGTILTEGRLDRLEGTLERSTPLHPNATSVILPAVPPSLSVTGADGVVVVATTPRQARATTTHLVVATDRVSAVRLSEEDLEDGLTEEHLSEVATILGRVEFLSGHAGPDPASVRELQVVWTSEFGTLVPSAGSVVMSQGDSEPRQAQARALLDTLGASPEASVHTLELPEAVSLPADAITLMLAGRGRRARIVTYEGRSDDRTVELDDPSLVVDFAPTGNLEEPLTDGQIQLLAGSGAPYVRVDLAVPVPEADPIAQLRLSSMQEELERHELLAEDPDTAVVKLSGFEEPLMNLPGGDTVDEIVFLQVASG